MPGEPSRPLDLTVKNPGKTGLTLTWSPPANDGGRPVTGYVVEKARGASGRFVKVLYSPHRKLCELVTWYINML